MIGEDIRRKAMRMAFIGWIVLGVIGDSRGADKDARPNILLILTDDQGYGDLGFHGNPKIRTPNLDRFARESVRLKSFYVSPVCSPTRASLLTGRYNYRTGVVDTFAGPLLDAVRRDDSRRSPGCGRVSHGHLRQMAPGRQCPDAAHRPGFPGIPGHQGRRDRPGVRPSGRQQLFRPDLAAQRAADQVPGLLQRRLHLGRHRFPRRGQRSPVLRLSRLQLPP